MLQRSKTPKATRRGTKAQEGAASGTEVAMTTKPEADVADAAVDTIATISAADPVATETAPAASAAATETAPAASAAAVETAPTGPAPVVDAAPPGPVPAAETIPATAPVGAPSVLKTLETPALPAPTQMMEKTMNQATKATETVMKATEEAVEFGRGNVEAVTKATQIYFAGVQDLGKQSFAVMQGLADHAMESAKALSGVKSLQEAVQIQSTFARAAIEKSVSESAKLGEATLKLTEQAFAPITARMTLAAEKFTKVPAVA